MCLIEPITYQELFLIPIALYVSTALYYFATWFKILRRDTSLSQQQKWFCVKVLVIAAIFWPIVLPITSLEKRTLSHSNGLEAVFESK